MNEQSVIEAEVSGLIALSAVMLVFLPFFLDRLRATREKLAAKWLRRARWLSWMTAVIVALPAVAAGVGLLTLWKVADLSGLLGWLTLVTIASVIGYPFLTVWLENAVWR